MDNYRQFDSALLYRIDMRRERILFPGAMGEQLAALLDLPEEKPIAFVLFAHCFTCSKDLTAVTRISY
ncbi:MAG: hypothetical protein V3U79_11635, partial [Dehalococcoidia bacterium]